MKEQKQDITSIVDVTIKHKIVGKDAFRQGLFDFLCTQMNFQRELLILCTTNGVILRTLPRYADDLVGFEIPKGKEKELALTVLKSAEGYALLVPSNPDILASVEALQRSMDAMIRILGEQEAYHLGLLKALDSIQNAVSIFDKDANLLYANDVFCQFFHIKDRPSVIGMSILDIIKRHGIRVHSMDANTSYMKMMDVLKYGKKALDYGVRLESKFDPSYAQLVQNDMFPLFDGEGKVSGMIEISCSHQKEMKRTRKIMGLTAEYEFKDIIGESVVIRDKIKLAKQFSKNIGNVLITGESGVGKELFAQSIHNYSARRKGPFVALNCASFPAELIESELFGYVEGAFTGASRKGQMGKIELADGGTLFLDEIGELPYYFQAKLLRVLETWMVTRVGSTKEVSVNVRLIAATNRNLQEMVASGLFRQDLYYRLQVLNIEIPPLRERNDDVLLTASHFLKQSAEQNGTALKHIDDAGKKVLKNYDWPGNARELRNAINRIDLLSKEDVITGSMLESSLSAKGFAIHDDTAETPADRIQKRRREIDVSHINLLKEALSITKGNKKDAAELLDMSRKTFYRMLEKYDC